MRNRSLAVLLTVLAWPALAQDDFRVMKLEQDLHNLENVVRDLSRQVADLKLQMTLSAGGPASRPRGGTPPAETWLDGATWDRLRPGMSEADVVGILGGPTSARSEAGARVLFYATEVGPAGILAGRVTLHDGKVTEITRPELR